MIQKIFSDSFLDKDGNLKDMEVKAAKSAIDKGETVHLFYDNAMNFSAKCSSVAELERTLQAFLHTKKANKRVGFE